MKKVWILPHQNSDFQKFLQKIVNRNKFEAFYKKFILFETSIEVCPQSWSCSFLKFKQIDSTNSITLEPFSFFKLNFFHQPMVLSLWIFTCLLVNKHMLWIETCWPLQNLIPVYHFRLNTKVCFKTDWQNVHLWTVRTIRTHMLECFWNTLHPQKYNFIWTFLIQFSKISSYPEQNQAPKVVYPEQNEIRLYTYSFKVIESL